MVEECTIKIKSPKMYEGKASLKSYDGGLELWLNHSFNSLYVSMVRFRTDGSVKDVYKYKHTFPDKNLRYGLIRQFKTLVQDKLEYHPDFLKVQRELEGEELITSLHSLVRKDEKMQGLLDLLSGKLQVQDSLEDLDFQSLPSLPEHMRFLILMAYTIGEKEYSQIPPGNVRDRLAKILTFPTGYYSSVEGY